ADATISADRGVTRKVPLTIEDIDGDDIIVAWAGDNSINIPADTHMSVYRDPESTDERDYILEFTPLRDEDSANPVVITVSASDGTALVTETVTVTVLPHNSPPVAEDYDHTIDEDSIGNFTVIVPTSDADGDTLKILIDHSADPEVGLFRNGVHAPLLGELRVPNRGKAILFIPAENYNTDGDSPLEIRYKLQETTSTAEISNLGVITVTILPSNDTPEIYGLMDSYSMKEDAVDFTVTFKARDVDGDSVTFVATHDDDAHLASVTIKDEDIVYNAVTGEYTVKVTIVPKENLYHTGAEFATITLGASDGTLPMGAASFQLTITPENDGIEPIDGTVEVRPGVIADTTAEDTKYRIDFADYYRDIDGDTIMIFSVGGQVHGTVERDKLLDTAAIFTPAKDYFTPQTNPAAGDYGAFTFMLSDPLGATYSGKVELNITPVNDKPSAPKILKTIDEDGECVIKPLDPGEPVHASDVDNAISELKLTDVGAAANGTVSWSAETGEITYRPKADWSGKETISYTIEDPDGAQATGTIEITVNPVDDEPRIAFEYNTGYPDTMSEPGDVLTWTMPEDPVGSEKEFKLHIWTPEEKVNLTLYITPENIDAAHPYTDIIANAATDIKFAFTDAAQTQGLVTITPKPNAFGSFVLVFELSDGGAPVVRRLVVTVEPENDLPVMTGDTTAQVAEDGSVSKSVSATDVETSAAELRYTIKAGEDAANGTVTFIESVSGAKRVCAWTYTPNADYYGADSFTLVVTDKDGGTDEKMVTVTVTPVNDKPTEPTGLSLDKTQYKGGDTATLTFTAGTDKANETARADLVYEIRLSTDGGTSWTPLEAAYVTAAPEQPVTYGFTVPSGANTAGLVVSVRTLDTENTAPDGWGGPAQYSAAAHTAACRADSTAPTISLAQTPTALTNGNVIITVTAGDPGAGASGVASVVCTAGGAAEG
ncbi:tandem-95 repeat protein, partial [Oscillospiraceae bacterium OttesenSCG-928-F05]|nr:tandem-95 repeat protein [Oscillospiraceae bacterium OttesenSCG-928-F05]